MLSWLTVFKISISYSTDLIESRFLLKNSYFNSFNAYYLSGLSSSRIRYTFEVLPLPRVWRISYLLLNIGYLLGFISSLPGFTSRWMDSFCWVWQMPFGLKCFIDFSGVVVVIGTWASFDCCSLVKPCYFWGVFSGLVIGVCFYCVKKSLIFWLSLEFGVFKALPRGICLATGSLLANSLLGLLNKPIFGF